MERDYSPKKENLIYKADPFFCIEIVDQQNG